MFLPRPLLSLIVGLIAFSASGQSLAVELFPTLSGQSTFWKKKANWVRKVKQGRDIFVYVDEKANDQGKVLKMQAIGMINAPISEVVVYASQYDRLINIKPYVRRAEFDSSQQILVIDAAAFTYTTHFKINTYQGEIQGRPTIQWEVFDGFFNGMQLEFVFTSHSERKTMIALYGEHKYKRLGIPRLFLEFGMEVVLQKAAKKIRRQIEDSFNRPD